MVKKILCLLFKLSFSSIEDFVYASLRKNDKTNKSYLLKSINYQTDTHIAISIPYCFGNFFVFLLPFL